jgi:uncharacterized protein YuzE
VGNRRAVIQVDPKAEAVFIRVRAGKSAQTVCLDDTVNVDYDAMGRVVSVEVLHVNPLVRTYPFE